MNGAGAETTRHTGKTQDRAPDGPTDGARRIALDADGLTLSGLHAEPAEDAVTAPPTDDDGTRPPRAVIVALHGQGMCADYFRGGTRPEAGLFRLATRLGHAVLALDRPGYGTSAATLPDGLPLAAQAATVRTALDTFARTHPTGPGFFLVGHSYGGKLAMHLAADDPAGTILGLDVSGTGRDYAPASKGHPDTLGAGALRLNWGPMRLYPPGTFRAARHLMTPVPDRERNERVPPWPLRFPGLAGRVRAPVRLTFAEHELWWRTDDASVASLAAQFTATSRLQVAREPDAGHNIGLGYAALGYHLRALAFLEDCLRSDTTSRA